MNGQLSASTFGDADREALAPPPQPGMLKSAGLAVAAHLLLVVALTHGLQWKRDTEVSAEAELWSAVPQEAAPTPAPAPPPPPPAPPAVQSPPRPDPQVQREAQIALEREKKEREAREREEEKRAEERRLEREKQRRAEAQRKREEAEAKKKEEARELAEAKRKQDEKKRREQEAQEKRMAQMREENLRRIQGMAGTGSPTATGSAAQASGPSQSWEGRVQSRVRPNIVFSDDLPASTVTDVEVRLAPDGTIVGRRIVRASGVKAWDDAVLRALDKTEVLPRDTDGRVPSSVVIGFRPRR